MDTLPAAPTEAIAPPPVAPTEATEQQPDQFITLSFLDGPSPGTFADLIKQTAERLAQGDRRCSFYDRDPEVPRRLVCLLDPLGGWTLENLKRLRGQLTHAGGLTLVQANELTVAEAVERLEALANNPVVERNRADNQVVEWSRAETVQAWAKVFGISRNTMAERFKDQSIRQKKIGKLHMVVLDDLPASARDKHREPPKK
jgi:hypothetical protein